MSDVVSKWAVGPSYGPVLTPLELYVLGATLQLHPILTNTLNEFHLVFNLQTGQTGGFSNDNQDVDLPFTKKDEPATIPRMAEIVIITKASPWCTVVRNEKGVTLGDICQTLWQQYSEGFITDDEFAALPTRWQESVKRIAGNNAAHAPNGGWNYYYSPSAGAQPRYKRTDWLREKYFFDGLDRDDEYCQARLGFKAPNVFLMSLVT